MGAGADGAGLPPAVRSRSRNGASMRAKTLRIAAAVLVVLGLVTAAAPAAAAPARVETSVGPALLQQLTAWLAGLWPGAGPGSAEGPEGLAQRLGPVANPDGEFAAPQHRPGASSDDDPTADPQLGPVADPNG